MEHTFELVKKMLDDNLVKTIEEQFEVMIKQETAYWKFISSGGSDSDILKSMCDGKGLRIHNDEYTNCADCSCLRNDYECNLGYEIHVIRAKKGHWYPPLDPMRSKHCQLQSWRHNWTLRYSEDCKLEYVMNDGEKIEQEKFYLLPNEDQETIS